MARDGAEALEILDQAPVDIVITDIEMPRMDGFELITAIRSRVALSDLPVVVLTSRSGEKHRERAFSLGADEYLVKPFQEQELVGVVEDLAHAPAQAH
jgi:chemosensory pili system protein ChpA (sensor histidine kinase/response regulator)